MPVTVIVNGSPSGSVTPAMETSTNLWFGGHSCGGSATAAVQSGRPGNPGTVVVVVGGRVLAVVLVDVLDVVVDGCVVVVVLEVDVVVVGRVEVVVEVVDG